MLLGSSFKYVMLGGFIFLTYSSGCAARRPDLLQSRNVATPFGVESKENCTALRQNLMKLRSSFRNPDKYQLRQRAEVMQTLSLQEENSKNIIHVSTPRQKMDLLIANNLLVNEKDVWNFIEEINKLDILGIVCRDIEETISPGFGEGIAYADFHRTGENYTAYIVFNEYNDLRFVFPPNNDPVDAYDRETILSLLGHASHKAVDEGIKAVIP